MAACALIVLGYILMSGPGSTESSFNPDIFSTRRIVIAPALCLAGYLLMIVGLIKKCGHSSLFADLEEVLMEPRVGIEFGMEGGG